ncbi:hypothetical protein DFH06DRAFT_1149243 [Mycena polygramma]|nr:hypothetical protein DFH06DRAFT_1149243 [Mycena polygramma]
MNSLLCTLLLVVASRSVAATFSTTCTKISFNPANDDLTALCVFNNYAGPFSTINLNSCVGNTDGKLAAGTDFSSSCSNVSVSGVTLSATCATPAGGSNPTSLDLVALTYINIETRGRRDPNEDRMADLRCASTTDTCFQRFLGRVAIQASIFALVTGGGREFIRENLEKPSCSLSCGAVIRGVPDPVGEELWCIALILLGSLLVWTLHNAQELACKPALRLADAWSALDAGGAPRHPSVWLLLQARPC